MPQLLLCLWASLDLSAWPYLAPTRLRSARLRSPMCQRRDVRPNPRSWCLRAAPRTSALAGDSTLNLVPDWTVTMWVNIKTSQFDGRMAAVWFLCLGALNWNLILCATDGWFKSWVLSRVFTEENQTQSSSTPNVPKCCCPRNGSTGSRFARCVNFLYHSGAARFYSIIYRLFHKIQPVLWCFVKGTLASKTKTGIF